MSITCNDITILAEEIEIKVGLIDSGFVEVIIGFEHAQPIALVELGSINFLSISTIMKAVIYVDLSSLVLLQSV